MQTYEPEQPIAPARKPRPVIKQRKIQHAPGDVISSISKVNYDPSRRRQVQGVLLFFDSLVRNGNGFAAQAVGKLFETTDILWVDEEDKPVPVDGLGPATRVKFVVQLKVTAGTTLTSHCPKLDAHQIAPAVEMCNSLGVLHGGCISYMFDM